MSDRISDATRWQRYAFADLSADASSPIEADAAATENASMPSEDGSAVSPESDHAESEATADAAAERGYDEGRERGYEAGYAEGHEAGRLAGEQAAETHAIHRLEDAADFISALRFQVADDTQAVSSALAELAIQAGKTLAGRALEMQPDHIVSEIEDLILAYPALTGHTVLYVNESQHGAVNEALADKLAETGWTLRVDPVLSAGDCRLDSDQVEVVSTCDERFARLGRLVDQIMSTR